MATNNIDEAFQLSAEKRHEIRQGRLLLHHFYSVLRTALYHASNNEAMLEPSDAFEKILDWFIDHEGGSGNIIVSQGLVYAGSMRIRIGSRQEDMVKDLEKLFKRRQIGGLNFLRKLDADEIRRTATTLVTFAKRTADKDGVPGMTAALEENGLGDAVVPMAPTNLEFQDGFAGIHINSDVGRSAQDFLKAHTVMSTMMTGNSALARSGLQRMVRTVSDVKGEAANSMIGLSIISATQDMSMRSMIVLLVALKIADQFGASRDIVAELGDVIVELAVYDKEVTEKAKSFGTPMAGMSSLGGLYQKRDWRVGTIRHQLTMAGRYLPVEPSSHDANLPLASRMAEVVRISCDYVDLITPTQMADSEPLLEGAPLAPHEALYRMRDYIGERYTEEVYAAMVRAVGLLPVGTAIETADGRSSIIIERTSDPLTFVARDMVTHREREAGFIRGPNQIVRVAVGADLLQQRSQTLLGEEYDKFQEMRQRVELMALGA